MTLYCHGDDCPHKQDCYRHTQPNRGRDEFATLPYDETIGHCEYFISNIPSEDLIRITAYYIWQRQGYPSNAAHCHWEEAYQSLCQGTGKIFNDFNDCPRD